jgi:hypothetical protein
MLAIRCVGIAGRWAILGKDVDEAGNWCCDLRFRGSLPLSLSNSKKFKKRVSWHATFGQ